MKMKISKRVLALGLFFACFLNGLLGQAALAYKCREQGSPRQELERATTVFIGKVTKVTDNGSVWINVFEVENTWKGPMTQHLIVRSGKSLYGIRFQEGEKYLVYAQGKDELTTSRCQRTRSLAEAKLDLKELGEGTKITSSVWDDKGPIRGNPNSKIYYLATCPIPPGVFSTRHRGEYFESEAAAKKAGYRKAKNCQ